MQAGSTACNYKTYYHLVLSHKTYQNHGVCYITIAYFYVTKTFVAHNKFPHVKVARNTKKVGQACCRTFEPRRTSDSFTSHLGFLLHFMRLA